MKKYLNVFCVMATIILLSLNFDICANEKPRQQDEQIVYVAGNPNLYPIEYYNFEKKVYEGILPDFYAELGRQKGIKFIYVNQDGEDNQKNLAENLQVEMVSAHAKNDAGYSIKEIDLFTYEIDGQPLEIAIGFTKIADEKLIKLVEDTINNADKDEWLKYAMSLSDSKAEIFNTFKYGFIGMLSIVSIVIVVCIFKIKKCKKELKRNEMVDPLTGIGDFKYFKYRFNQSISERTQPLYNVALIGFDAENSEKYLGTKETENIYHFVANTLSKLIGDDDFVARVGNGIFVLAFVADSDQKSEDYIQTILNKLNSYKKQYTSDVEVCFHAGIYSLSKDHIEIETAIDNANKGYNHAINHELAYCVCDKEFLEKEALKARLQVSLSEAINNNEIELYLQFIVDSSTNKICGAEALSRWHNKAEGTLGPSHYIEEMEKAGIIDKLDFYIFDKVCQKMQKWQNTKYGYLCMSCNFTRITISKKDFVQWLKEIVSKYDFDHSKLVLELTEDSFEANNVVSRQNIEACKEMGFKIALDDLGIGYTSFIDIYNYPIDIIKVDKNIIDKSFNERGFKILSAITHFSHELGMKVLCEGVETLNATEVCKKADCDYIQGFYYSRVFPEDEAISYYEKCHKN